VAASLLSLNEVEESSGLKTDFGSGRIRQPVAHGGSAITYIYPFSSDSSFQNESRERGQDVNTV
jgi:hypothetical protein